MRAKSEPGFMLILGGIISGILMFSRCFSRKISISNSKSADASPPLKTIMSYYSNDVYTELQLSLTFENALITFWLITDKQRSILLAERFRYNNNRSVYVN